MEWITDSFFKFVLTMIIIAPFAAKGFRKMGIGGTVFNRGARHIISRLLK